MASQSYRLYFLHPEVRELFDSGEYVRYRPLYTELKAQDLNEAKRLADKHLVSCSCLLDGKRYVAVPQRLVLIVETNATEWPLENTEGPAREMLVLQGFLKKDEKEVSVV